MVTEKLESIGAEMSGLKEQVDAAKQDKAEGKEVAGDPAAAV